MENQSLVGNENESWTCCRSGGSPKFKIFLGTLLTIASTLFECCAFVSLQSMSELPPVFEINAIGYSVALATTCIILPLKRELPKISRDQKLSLLAVCSCMVLSDVFLFNSHSALLPLGSIVVLQEGIIIGFSLLLSWKFLNEHIACWKLVLVAIAIAGLAMNVTSELPIFDAGEFFCD